MFVFPDGFRNGARVVLVEAISVCCRVDDVVGKERRDGAIVLRRQRLFHLPGPAWRRDDGVRWLVRAEGAD